MKLLIGIGAALLLAACGKPGYNQQLSQGNSRDGYLAITAPLSQEDRVKLSQYFARKSRGVVMGDDPIPLGVDTVGEAIEQQDRVEAKAQAERDQLVAGLAKQYY